MANGIFGNSAISATNITTEPMKEENNMKNTVIALLPASTEPSIWQSRILAKAAKLIGTYNFYENGAEKLYDKVTEVRHELIKYKDMAANLHDLINEADDTYKFVLEEQLENTLGMIAYVKADLRVLGKAIKETKSIVLPSDRALMKCRDQASSEQVAKEKPVPAGARTFERSPKIKLGNYKVMSFDVAATLTDFQPYVTAIFDAANADNKQLSRQKFNEFCSFVDMMAMSRTPLTVNASKAKINIAHQSLAAEIAGVVFNNTTTDKIVSINHNIYNLFNGLGWVYISPDRDQATKAVEKVERNILRLICDVGVRMITLNGRTIDYDVWCSTPSQQKVGAMYLGERKMMAETSDARNLLCNGSEYMQRAYNGPEMLKRQAVLFTPSCPMKDYDSNVITLDDICMFNEVEIERSFKNVMEVDGNGNATVKAIKALGRSVGDGALLLTNAESQQIRGFGIKAFGVCVKDLIEKISEICGTPIPEIVSDIDGIPYNTLSVKAFATTSTWKWGKLGLSWTEFKERVNKLADKYPTINLLRVTRLASSAEEGQRRLSRQTTQQFLVAKDEQLAKLVKKPVGKLNRMKTASGMLPKMMELNKPIAERSFTNRLYELMPSLVASKHLQANWEITFHARFSEVAANKVPVDGIYPYITEDPFALLQILVFGEDPQKVGLGRLVPGQINLPCVEEGKELFFARYPSNYISASILRNHNDPIYDCVGNVALLPIDADTLIRSDGDVDGDEAFITFNETVIDMMKDTLNTFTAYLVDFPHDKAKKKEFHSRKELRDEMAEALYNANKFGGDVGKNSILATKWFQNAMEALHDGDKAKAEKCIHNAMYAYIGSILAIDSVKTGEMPQWLINKLRKISDKDYAGKNPWNQRFNKHSMSSPWFDESYWGPIDKLSNEPVMEEEIPHAILGNVDDIELFEEASQESSEEEFAVRPESSSTTDRIARFVLDAVNAKNYTFDSEGMVFDPNMLLSHVSSLASQASGGVFNPKLIPAFNARNYIDDGEDLAIATKIQKGERIKPKELFRFFWKNANSMMYRMRPADGSSNASTNAAMINEYMKFVRDIMVNFGDGKVFAAMDADHRRLSVVNAFIRDAFEMRNGNGIQSRFGNELETKKMKGSYAKFVLGVFAKDIVENLEENLDIPQEKRFINLRMAATGNDERQETTDAEMLETYTEYDGCDIDGDFCNYVG